MGLRDRYGQNIHIGRGYPFFLQGDGGPDGRGDGGDAHDAEELPRIGVEAERDRLRVEDRVEQAPLARCDKCGTPFAES